MVMLPCKKRQTENYMGEEQHRCIHREADLFSQIVNEDQCSQCPHRLVPKDILATPKTKPGDKLLVLDLQPGYPPCPYRSGSGGGTTCSITKLGVNPEICGRCDDAVREHTATFGDKISNYFGAVRTWTALGMPTRSKEEIKQLFEEHCKGCDRYDAEKHACKSCGCSVSTSVSPLANKLAMATEHCPLGRF